MHQATLLLYQVHRQRTPLAGQHLTQQEPYFPQTCRLSRVFKLTQLVLRRGSNRWSKRAPKPPPWFFNWKSSSALAGHQKCGSLRNQHVTAAQKNWCQWPKWSIMILPNPIGSDMLKYLCRGQQLRSNNLMTCTWRSLLPELTQSGLSVISSCLQKGLQYHHACIRKTGVMRIFKLYHSYWELWAM